MKTFSLLRKTRFSRPLIQGCIVACVLAHGAANAQPESVPAPTAPVIMRAAGVTLAPRVLLSAHPLDSNHEITAVRFLLDGATLAECGPPGRFVWDTSGLRAGRHVVQVQAFDGERFVGLSEPCVVYVGETSGTAIRNFDVPFFTYEFDPRRAAGIVAPRLPANTNGGTARIVEGGDAASPRLTGVSVEVYLNGVKQEFAPAARVASMEEMAPPETAASRPRRKVTRRRPARSAQAIKNAAAKKASTSAQRTVWLPARALLERLGARVSWRSKDQTLVAILNVAGAPRRILLSARPGRAAQAEVGGRHFALATPVRLADNALMVPLEFCREALELRVRWQKEDRRVEMFTPITPA